MENNPDTLALYARIDEWLEADFFPRLRELTNMPDADTEEMLDVVDYIDWANKSGMNLKIDLTDEDWRLISLADESRNYEDYAATPDAEMMATWQLQQVYKEMSQVVRGELSIRDTPVLT